jgi:hypothetical protein
MSNGTLNKGSLVKGGGGAGGGGSTPASVSYFNIESTTSSLDTHLTLGNAVMIYKNGVLLQPTADYTISGSTITFVTDLENGDKIAVVNGSIDGLVLPTTEIIAAASVTISEIKSNTNYKLTSNALTDITFSGCETSDEVTTIEFTTGENDVTFTDNSGIDWADGETPSFYAYQKYLIVIFNKVGFVKEIY